MHASFDALARLGGRQQWRQQRGWGREGVGSVWIGGGRQQQLLLRLWMRRLAEMDGRTRVEGTGRMGAAAAVTQRACTPQPTHRAAATAAGAGAGRQRRWGQQQEQGQEGWRASTSVRPQCLLGVCGGGRVAWEDGPVHSHDDGSLHQSTPPHPQPNANQQATCPWTSARCALTRVLC